MKIERLVRNAINVLRRTRAVGCSGRVGWDKTFNLAGNARVLAVFKASRFWMYACVGMGDAVVNVTSPCVVSIDISINGSIWARNWNAVAIVPFWGDGASLNNGFRAAMGEAPSSAKILLT